MNPIKSGVSYFRRALKIKGSTEHSGRGFFDLEYDCTPNELRSRIEDLITKFPDRFNVKRDETGIEVEIKPELMAEQYYHTLRISSYGNLIVGM